MRIIGITGGIGAGKSTVLTLLEQDYHAYILEADKVAHVLMEPGQPAFQQIVEVFSEQLLDAEGRIDRGRLGELVFRSPEWLERLNHIVHPEVKRYILEAISRCRQTGDVDYFVIEAALLIEDGYTAICDEIWYIHVPRELRLQRLMLGRGRSREHWERVMENQAADSFYRDHCSRVIENQGSISDIKKQIRELLKNT